MDRRFGSRCGRRGRLGVPPPLSLLHAHRRECEVEGGVWPGPSSELPPLSLPCDPHFTVLFQFQTCLVIHLSFQVPTFAVMSSEKEFFRLRGANVEGRHGNVFLSSWRRAAGCNPFPDTRSRPQPGDYRRWEGRCRSIRRNSGEAKTCCIC